MIYDDFLELPQKNLRPVARTAGLVWCCFTHGVADSRLHCLELRHHHAKNCFLFILAQFLCFRRQKYTFCLVLANFLAFFFEKPALRRSAQECKEVGNHEESAFTFTGKQDGQPSHNILYSNDFFHFLRGFGNRKRFAKLSDNTRKTSNIREYLLFLLCNFCSL